MIAIESNGTQFSLSQTAITVVFGPSGIGKTTLLKRCAGHLPLDGQLLFDDAVVEDSNHTTKPQQRDFCYLTQGINLIDTMTVRQNLALAVKFSKHTQPNVVLQQMIKLVEIDALLSRPTNQLSGGEYQLVSLCMAMVSGSRWLLLDEPLSAVDKARKHRILSRLKRWHRSNEVPFLYVTHDVHEMAMIADDVLLMSEAATHVISYQQLIDAVDSEFMSQYANENILETQWLSSDGQLQQLKLVDTDLMIYALGAQPEQTQQWLTIPLVDISISLAPLANSSILNQLPAVISKIGKKQNDSRFISTAIGSHKLSLRITEKSCVDLKLAEGSDCYVCFKAPKLHG